MIQDRKKKGVLLLAGFAAISIMGCAKKEDPLSRIQNAGELKVAVWKQGEAEESLCSSVAEALGVSVSYVDAESADEALNLVEEAQADLAIGGIVTDQEIGKDLSMSAAYLQQPWYVVTLRGDYSDSVAAFEGRTLAVTHEVPDLAFRWTSEISDVDFVGISTDMVTAALTQNALQGYICLEKEAQALAETSADVQFQSLTGGKPLAYGAVTKSADRRLHAVIENVIGQQESVE